MYLSWSIYVQLSQHRLKQCPVIGPAESEASTCVVTFASVDTWTGSTGKAVTAAINVSAGAGRAKLIYVLLRGKRYMPTRAEGSSLTQVPSFHKTWSNILAASPTTMMATSPHAGGWGAEEACAPHTPTWGTHPSEGCCPLHGWADTNFPNVWREVVFVL